MLPFAVTNGGTLTFPVLPSLHPNAAMLAAKTDVVATAKFVKPRKERIREWAAGKLRAGTTSSRTIVFKCVGGWPCSLV